MKTCEQRCVATPRLITPPAAAAAVARLLRARAEGGCRAAAGCASNAGADREGKSNRRRRPRARARGRSPPQPARAATPRLGAAALTCRPLRRPSQVLPLDVQ